MSSSPSAATHTVSPETLVELFPSFSAELVEALVRKAHVRQIPKGTTVYEQGFPCEIVPFIVSGVVRVFKIGDTGREVTLFRVNPGQTCILSTSCGVSGANYPAIAVVEEDVTMLAIPALEFRRWVERFPQLQEFVNGMLAERLAETMMVVEEVAFRRVDLRLAEWLLRESEPPRGGNMETTHAHIATELGSAREVISRILKDFERHGYVALGRGQIEVVSRPGLSAYADLVQSGRPPAEGVLPTA